MKKTVRFDNTYIEYELERKNVKNINLRVRTNGSVYVSAGSLVSEKFIESFIISKAEFILNAKAKMRECADNVNQTARSLNSFVYLGEKLSVIPVSANKNYVNLNENTLEVHVKNTDTVTVERTVLSWQKSEAERLLTPLCEKYYPIFRKYLNTFPELRFRKMKSQWGSCQIKRRVLTFNTALVHAPLYLAEYVIVHEFAHFVHADHSKDFHKCVNAVLPDAENRRKLLRQYSSLLR